VKEYGGLRHFGLLELVVRAGEHDVDAKPYTDPAQIKANLIAQLTAPVRWTYIVKNMLADGVTEFTELGPGTVLQGLIRKVNPEAVVESKSTL